MSYAETKQAVTLLISELPRLETERIPSAASDWARLMPGILLQVHALTLSPEESHSHNQNYRTALLRAASIDCAGGAPVERCRSWFRCLASLAAWTPSTSAQMANLGEATIWAALAGWFDAAPPSGWPEDPKTNATSDRIIYRLLTRRPVETNSPRELFENREWEDLCTAMESSQADAAARCFRSLAAWWIKEYRASETSAYDPDNFSTFEPAPNAALAIALVRDHMDIRFHKEAHERFYYVARMQSP